MKRTKLLSVLLAIAIAISMVATVNADPFRGGKLGNGPGGGIRVLMNLDLSQDQKQSIYDILQKYEDEQQATRANLRSNKDEFFDVASGGNFNEENVRKSFQELVPAMEDAYVLRAKVHSEVMAVLTDDQLEELQKIKSERAGRRQDKGNKEFRHAVLETWLTMDSEK
jgi:Spy/CpxP family protein refolding chaperone